MAEHNLDTKINKLLTLAIASVVSVVSSAITASLQYGADRQRITALENIAVEMKTSVKVDETAIAHMDGQVNGFTERVAELDRRLTASERVSEKLGEVAGDLKALTVEVSEMKESLKRIEDKAK